MRKILPWMLFILSLSFLAAAYVTRFTWGNDDWWKLLSDSAVTLAILSGVSAILPHK